MWFVVLSALPSLDSLIEDIEEENREKKRLEKDKGRKFRANPTNEGRTYRIKQQTTEPKSRYTPHDC